MNRAERADRLTEEIRHSSTLQAALTQLLEALRLAESSGRPPKAFAVEFAGLIHGGTTAPALKWMVASHLVLHHVAGNRIAKSASTSPCLEFSDRSRFTLTEQGLAVAQAVLKHRPQVRRSGPAHKPHWDERAFELRFNRTIVLRLTPRAEYPICILQTFEEERWARHIDDPLRGGHPDPQKRLQNVLYRLNTDLMEKLLVFHADGTGKGVCWEATPDRVAGK